MGVEPYLLSSSLLGVLAQRLVRRLCPACRRHEDGRWWPVGCERCGPTGFQGRSGVYELLVVDDGVRRQIHQQASDADIRAAAIAGGMQTMREDGQRWIDAGDTTLEEVMRVTGD